MKFDHRFKLTSQTDSTRIYEADGNIARLDFISPTALRVACYKKGEALAGTYNVCPEGSMPYGGRDKLSLEGFECVNPQCNISESTESFTLSEGIEVRLDRKNFLLEYYLDGRKLFGDRAPLAYNFDGEFGGDLIHYISRDGDEKIFGLGDKGGRLNKSGRTFKIETTDTMGYNAEIADPLYKHIPFFICENGVGAYGIFYDTSATSYFDFGVEHNNYYEHYKFFKTEDNALVYYVFFGSKLEILKQFTHLAGRQAFPPKWSFDYCASTMAYTDAPDSEVQMNGFLEKVRELGLNCQGFYLSSGYTSIGDKRFVFNWNYDKFPKPEEFIRNFAENGINIIPNIKPAFLKDHPMYGELERRGLFVKNSDGTPFVTQFWDGVGSYLDFTNREAFDFWKSEVTEKLLDNGIICTWNDNNEFDIKDTEAKTQCGVPACRMRPDLTYLMDMASYEAQIEKRGNLRPFLSSRSGNVGVRRLAQTWSGDNRTAFEDLRYCHNIGLTMSLSGLYFYGHDLGGFSGCMPSRELLMRWLQHGLFEPRFTIHSWNDDGSSTMPWSYPDIIDSVKGIFAQRKRLIPYLYSCAYKSVYDEEPMNAPVFLYYDDAPCESDSMLVGRDILAAFVFDEGRESTKVYLPKGEDWYLGSRLYSGGQSVELAVPAYSSMPYFVRAGSVIPTDESGGGFRTEERLVLTVYPKERGSFTSEFFTDDGESFDYLSGKCTHLMLEVNCDEAEVRVKITNRGSTAFDGEIRLCEADGRRLAVED